MFPVPEIEHKFRGQNLDNLTTVNNSVYKKILNLNLLNLKMKNEKHEGSVWFLGYFWVRCLINIWYFGEQS